MEEYQESLEPRSGEAAAPPRVNRWMAVVVVLLLGAAGVGLAYGYRQQTTVSQLLAHETVMKRMISQLQGQLDILTAKQTEMSVEQESAKNSSTRSIQTDSPSDRSASDAASSSHVKARYSVVRRHPAIDKRYQQRQAQLADQQKQLKETQDEVAKNRADLEGNINSTRDELNGSIAKTHDELVALERRGERNYFEFDLYKSKQFQRIGPLTLSLRKADIKHKHFNLEMFVDDNQLSKKNVNLYEPIWIHTESDSQPIQIVVNRIEKNVVHGYVNAPKYKPSELAAAGTPSLTPVAAHSPAGDQKPPSSSSNPPQQ